MDARNGDLYESPDAAKAAGVPLEHIVELRGREDAIRDIAAKVAVMEQLEKPRKPPFDPSETDCFGRYLNRTDDEITSLILGLSLTLDNAGEYDQGDSVTLDWDTARDVVKVADMLWHHALRQRQNGGLAAGQPRSTDG